MRSDVGSALAVGVAVTHLAEVVRQGVGAVGFEDLLRHEVPDIVSGWREGVLAHVGANPFTETEVARAGTSLDEDPIVAYGATLLIVMVGDEGVGLAQIGDGDALIRTHGFATRPVPGDPRLVAGETTSLCLESAVSDFRYAALPGGADADLVLLASDGYANSFADKDWWRAVVGDLAWFLSDHGFDEFADQFPQWLGESAVVGGDDVSAVVIVRTPLVVPPDDVSSAVVPPATSRPLSGVDRPLAGPAPDAGTTPAEVVAHDARVPSVEDPGRVPAPSEPGRHRALLLLTVALLLAIGVAAAWLATNGFGSRSGHGGPTPSQTPTPSSSHSTPNGGGHGHSGRHQGNPPGKPTAPGGSSGSQLIHPGSTTGRSLGAHG